MKKCHYLLFFFLLVGCILPDEWEKAQSLNPNDPDDRNLTDKDGWTNLERYLNGLAHP